MKKYLSIVCLVIIFINISLGQNVKSDTTRKHKRDSIVRSTIDLSLPDIKIDTLKPAIYTIYKIDSTEKSYLIYAKYNDLLYKIISKKETVNSDNKIKINKNYELTLRTAFTSKHVDDFVNCFAYYSETNVICLEKGMVRNLFITENIKGLCYVKGH